MGKTICQHGATRVHADVQKLCHGPWLSTATKLKHVQVCIHTNLPLSLSLYIYIYIYGQAVFICCSFAFVKNCCARVARDVCLAMHRLCLPMVLPNLSIRYTTYHFVGQAFCSVPAVGDNGAGRQPHHPDQVGNSDNINDKYHKLYVQMKKLYVQMFVQHILARAL